ncbi:helix-turn-helix domain-containing protein [Nocardia sp. NPDC003482]|uniref:helix-turn-helix domain-containing protein n=1 Tax=Nocardia sp. NPDC004068 TaxID=3364303 RepID=UPI0036A38144
MDPMLHPQSRPAESRPSLAALTNRQREVAVLVSRGMTNRMIASHLGIAEWTVVNHLRQVMLRLRCPSRLHVALVVQREQGSETA